MRTEQMMAFNIIYMVFGLIICFIYRLFNKNTNKIQFIDILVIIILVLISSLRCNVGSDYYGYYLRYNGILNNYQNIFQIFNTSNSILFDIICFITMKLTHYKFAIFWVISCLIYIPLIIYLRKTNQKPYTALFIFIFSGFFLITNNIIRQTLAMALVFISYNFVSKKKYFKFILLILLASMFHKTAIIAGILILISRKIKPSIRNLFIANVIGILLLLLFSPLVSLIDSFIPDKYLNYIIFNYGGMLKQTLSIVGYVIFYNVASLILITKSEKIKEVSFDYYKMISTIIIAIPISIIAIKCWPINRISLYLYTFIIILLPIIYNGKQILGKFKLLISLVVIIWFSFLNIFGGDNEYYSYDTYLNTIPDYPRNVIYKAN